jgi:hypothetical protein
LIKNIDWDSILTKDFLEEKYIHQKMGITIIAKEVGCGVARIRECFRKFNIITRTQSENLTLKAARKIPVNEDYFNQWSHRMAYILGFIITDGNVNQKQSTLMFGIQNQDEEVLQFIKNEICPTAMIRSHSQYDKRTNKTYNQKRLYINCCTLVRSLELYGVIPSKGGKEIFPICPQEFLPNLILGIFDGDGTISYQLDKGYNNKKRYFDFGICSQSENFLDSVKKILGNLGKVKRQQNIYNYRIRNIDDIIQTCDWMYSKREFSLSRKYSKYLELKEYVKDN